jgi:hypothetical protein
MIIAANSWEANFVPNDIGTPHFSIHEALVLAQPQSQFFVPARFTVTIPLQLLGILGPQLQLFVAAGQNPGAGDLDIAPPAPMVIDLPDTPALSPTLFCNEQQGTECSR